MDKKKVEADILVKLQEIRDIYKEAYPDDECYLKIRIMDDLLFFTNSRYEGEKKKAKLLTVYYEDGKK